jgi:hypothetical protein
MVITMKKRVTFIDMGEATAKGWAIASMRGDWKTMFPQTAFLTPTGRGQ